MGTHRVLILLDQLGVGGAAQVALSHALSLNRNRFSPIVCVAHSGPAYGQDDMLKRVGVPVVQIERKSAWETRPWKPLWRVLPDISILHSHGGGANFWGRIWGRLFRVPIVVTHYHTAADQKGRPLHLIDRTMSPLSDRIVAVSQFDRQLAIRLEHLPPDKVVTIYNGVDMSKFDVRLSKLEARRRLGLPGDKWLLAIVARLDRQKNHRVLLDALTLLPEQLGSRPDCLMVGSGPLEEQLRRDVAERGLQESVSFLGERGDVPTILRAIDLLVLPSHWECLPVVILEALSARCPIVATAVGGVPEVLDGLGWPLVEPGNPGRLAQAIVSVINMGAAERNDIAEKGRQLVMDRFSRERSVAEVEKLYELLLSPQGRQRSLN
jgi:glycosyltransferase involved in cell wall biosynthesis